MKLRLEYFIIPGLVFLVLWVGGVLTAQGMHWYNYEVLLPLITPPTWVFRVAWGIIGLCTIFSLIIFWRVSSWDALFYGTLMIFILNAFLNISWSYVFFVRHEIGRAFGISVALEATLIILIFLLWKRSRSAALWLLPYALWVAIACYLTYDVYLINEAI